MCDRSHFSLATDEHSRPEREASTAPPAIHVSEESGEITATCWRSKVCRRRRCSPAEAWKKAVIEERMEMMSPNLQNDFTAQRGVEKLHCFRLWRNDDLAPASGGGKRIRFVGSDMGLQQQPQSY